MRTKTRTKPQINHENQVISSFSTLGELVPKNCEKMRKPDHASAVKQSLPVLFKTKLLAYLSRFCSVEYSHNLSSLGLSQQEIQSLLEIPTPTIETDLETDLAILNQYTFKQWFDGGVFESLLRCSVFMFLQPSQGKKCRQGLRQFLGNVLYRQLVNFLSYLKFCYHWLESYAELFEDENKPYISHSIVSLLEPEQGLKTFFSNHDDSFQQDLQQQQKERVLASHKPLLLTQTPLEQKVKSGSNLDNLVNTRLESPKNSSDRTAELEAINRELESFSYAVSHDLRAPLRVIDGFSEVLCQTYQNTLDAKGQHYLQRIRANCQKMGGLIDALLQLSRVTRHPLQCEPVDLSAIAQEIATELTTTNPEREVKFIIAPEIVAEGDSRLLRNVVENLLNNAWKYTSHHSQACIEFSSSLQTDGTVAYFVRDDGAGFDMAYSDKLFGPFARLHSESEFPGHGIGLATVQRIIHRHGGRIWAQGAVEKGATFYFSLV